MRAFKLVKEYPGSPYLETIIIERNHIPKFYYFYDKGNRKSYFKECIEDNPEYWEEVTDIYYLVCVKEEIPFNTWEAVRVEICDTTNYSDNRKFFKSKEEAETFILFNKPCLSFNDIRDILDKFQSDAIINDIKSRI
jgi:hypothetical protein